MRQMRSRRRRSVDAGQGRRARRRHGALRNRELLIAEQRALLGAIRLTPEVHAIQLVRPMKSSADAAGHSRTHDAAAIPSHYARGIRLRRRITQRTDIHHGQRLPSLEGRIGIGVWQPPPAALGIWRSNSTSSLERRIGTGRPTGRPRDEMLCECLHAVPPLLRPHGPHAVYLFRQVEKPLPILGPAIVHALHVPHKARLGGKVFLAKTAGKRWKSRGQLTKLPQGSTNLVRQILIPRLKHWHPRSARFRNPCSLRGGSVTG